MNEQDRTSAAHEAAARLARLSDEFFEVAHTTDPFSATQLGVSGFDALVPDPSRDGAARGARRLAAIEARLDEIDASLLGEQDQTNHAVLARLAWGARSDLEHGLWEGNASAGGYVSPQAMVFQSVPTALLADAAAVDGYVQRLRGLGGYLDAVTRRYREASHDGRVPTEVGVRQAAEQLEGHLAKDLAADTLVAVDLPDQADPVAFRAEAASIVEAGIRPAMRRLLACLREELLPVARGDEAVGIRFIPGGAEGYRAAVRRHTTTELTPEQIHQIGLDCLADLEEEWAELSGRVLGITDTASVLARLREDPALRFTSSDQIVRTVTDALRRAEEARDDWFPPFRIPGCVIEEIDPVEAGNAPPGLLPAPGGRRAASRRPLHPDQPAGAALRVRVRGAGVP